MGHCERNLLRKCTLTYVMFSLHLYHKYDYDLNYIVYIPADIYKNGVEGPSTFLLCYYYFYALIVYISFLRFRYLLHHLGEN